VVEEWAGRGEWFCALVWARLLGERGRQADALEVLGPYTATGWWTAVAATAELLEGWGRIEEAIETVQARMAVGHPRALEAYTRLLARHGRAAEAFTMLLPHADNWALATALESADLRPARCRARRYPGAGAQRGRAHGTSSGAGDRPEHIGGREAPAVGNAVHDRAAVVVRSRWLCGAGVADVPRVHGSGFALLPWHVGVAVSWRWARCAAVWRS
jgi:hypothetical protein